MNLIDQVRDLCGRKEPYSVILQDFCSFLRRAIPHYTWVGIYGLKGETLTLAVWDGPAPTQHVEIPIGQGICGLATRENRTVVVDDVNKDPRYLQCSLSTKSEIVVPIVDRASGRILGEIDIDSDRLGAFDEVDRHFLEWCADRLAEVNVSAGW